MIVRGLAEINEYLHKVHVANREEYYRMNPPRRARRYRIEPNGANNVSDHDDDYVVDALFDVPNR
jgi:hypothetical protein